MPSNGSAAEEIQFYFFLSYHFFLVVSLQQTVSFLQQTEEIEGMPIPRGDDGGCCCPFAIT
jgi:hypothetical protein